LEQEEMLKAVHEQKAKVEWESLDEDTRFFRTMEDLEKRSQITFEAAEDSCQVEGRHLQILEERVFREKGEWIFLRQEQSLTEEEKAKLKKQKKATSLPVEPITFKGWLDLSALGEKDQVMVSARCRLQALNPADTALAQDLYIKLKVVTQDCFNKSELVPQLSVADLIPQRPPSAKKDRKA